MPWRHLAEVEVQLQLFLTLTLVAAEWSSLNPANLPPWYLLNKRLGGPQSWSGHFGEYNNILFLSGIEPQVIQLTVWCLHLYQLSYHSCWTAQFTVQTADSIALWTCTGWSGGWVCTVLCRLTVPGTYVLCCVVVLGRSIQLLWQHCKLADDHYLPHPFQFIIQQSAYSWCYTAVCWLLTVQLNWPSSPLP